MYVNRQQIALAVDASGDQTAYSTDKVTGQVLQIRYVPDASTPLDTGADLTITGEDSGVAILTKLNIGTSAFTVAPRQASHLASDGTASLYAAAGVPVTVPVALANERIKVVVAQGGNAKLGTLHVYVG